MGGMAELAWAQKFMSPSSPWPSSVLLVFGAHGHLEVKKLPGSASRSASSSQAPVLPEFSST